MDAHNGAIAFVDRLDQCFTPKAERIMKVGSLRVRTTDDITLALAVHHAEDRAGQL